ncbi:polysaccharide biosynthesis tyrosine autokinase [Helcobacillus massiliensis]|uniref:non-specific protein-tyrosine kinase n=1 Tax=Helcobacillus massiliensis TaxID=521392 RepID=A0A839R2V5_9MICO|nr:polysaccharide biosynthesis tyrosine autokinase [Helcobacillus massiliensis]MBB3023496.1 capsular exopolysaccharide synthesis family protein [Helcobacillus massiliensis]MCT1556788.1 polysaccharide biosynthesis tyrosine autokinase [Helcobacillus massiliensis]MCT2035612.1 polysaccharide biosynthesis tyrosine autokinase [Helcobacillus massiliensis]MCT2330936.1 polysaccharide biosynthesis tyrosine autokinase [Helcobacillus massiliensis]
MTIEDFFRLLLRNALLISLLTLLGLAGGYAFSYTKPTVYEATALGYVTARVETDANGQEIPMGGSVPAAGGDAEKYGTAQTYLPLFNTPTVGQAVIDDLGLQGTSAHAIASNLTASIDPNVPIITVKARASSPQRAQEIANSSITAVNREGAFLLTGDRDSKDAPMTLISYEAADVPSAPVAPNRMKFAAAGAAAGLVLALALSWLRNRNDSRVRTVDDIKSKTPVTALGVLPDSRDLTRSKSGELPEPKEFHSKEALRKLRTNLRFANVDNPPRSIVVSSSAPGEGKSTVAANLARVIARSGEKVILIDADLRRPTVAKAFQVDGAVGLSQLIAGSVDLEDALQPSGVRGLSILPAGQIPPNPSELLGSNRMADIVSRLSADHFVVIDAPPILAVTDAVLLSRHTDGALIVAVPGRTRVEGLSRSIESVRAVGGTVLGAVMNRASGNLITRLAYGDAEYGYSAYGYAATTYTYTEDRKGNKVRRRKRKLEEDLEAPEHGIGEDAEIRPAGVPASAAIAAAPAAAAKPAPAAASPAPAAERPAPAAERPAPSAPAATAVRPTDADEPATGPVRRSRLGRRARSLGTDEQN